MIEWELLDVVSAQALGRGPKSNPIYLGGHAPRREGDDSGGSFVGNMANLFIFDAAPTEEEVGCMFRAQSYSIGSCRAPDTMWRKSFWESFTGDTLETDDLYLSNEASLHDSFGLDLTANGEFVGPMANGSMYTMDG